MWISRVASRWTVTSAALGLLVLPAGFAVSAPTAAEHRSSRAHSRAWELPEGSHALVRSAVMTDRLRPNYDLSDRSERRSSRRASRGRHGSFGGIDLRDRVESGGKGGGAPTTPIPEPSSILMLAAGGGLVAFMIRRKLARVG